MPGTLHNPRTPQVEVDCLFTDRWSPRSFLEEPLSQDQISALFEAARWTPSCYNEQPWFFRYAVTAADRERFASALVERNCLWATKAPLLIFVLTRLHFTGSGEINRHAAFDAGAAWMALALQARRLGLYAHAMAGFSRKRAFEVLGVAAEEFDILAAVAVGRHGPADRLPEELAVIEKPNERKGLAEVAREG
ncbi:nitroreductase family protein [Desulfuromonas acetexigens]|uniref:Nitroreductase n=1 Tax=Trichloromonas acetexigens TaxID=38815 RepID=A0A550JAV3_9BACT|nr:nitroreductase family protein [Desulfuromonas acetexigens]TRO80327.1 nitroreductase [Desulfuromonas acetexigens]